MLLATVIFSFNACSDDDDNGSNNHLTGKLLTGITLSESGYDTYLNFRYANGKLIEMICADDEISGSYIFNYSGNTVTVVGEEYTQTFKLNNAGYVESATGGFGKKITFEYNKDSYLTKVRQQNDYSDEETSLFYDNEGNLISANHIERDKYDGQETKNQVTFTPSNYPTRGKNFFFLGGDICPLLGDLPDNFWTVYYAGLLGKDPKSLTSKIKIKENDSFEYERNFTYTFNNDGSVSSMVIDKNANNNESEYVPEWIKATFVYE